MRVGIHLPLQGAAWDDIHALARQADELGFASLWLFDHVLSLGDETDRPVFECWSALAVLAATTTRVSVGTLVTNNELRHPALLAKMATTVDHVSGGRLVVGLGAGYREIELDALGLRWCEIDERLDRLEETCAIVRAVWSGGDVAHHGDAYSVHGRFAPPPRERPPLLLGGRSRRLLALVARYADAWNLPGGNSGVTPDDLAGAREVLAAECESIGRPVDEIETSLALSVIVSSDREDAVERLRRLTGRGPDEVRRTSIVGDPDDVVERLTEFAAAGLDHFIVGLLHGSGDGDLPLLAREVLPRVAAL